jgi:SMC interacting uncharacterized protein involved in chromosome segregation
MTTIKVSIILAQNAGEIEYTIVRSYKNGDEEITEEITMPIVAALKFVDEEIGKCNEFISEMKYKLINFEKKKQRVENKLERVKKEVDNELNGSSVESDVWRLFEV